MQSCRRPSSSGNPRLRLGIYEKNHAWSSHTADITEGRVIPVAVSSLPVTFHPVSRGCRQEGVKPAPSLWCGCGSRRPAASLSLWLRYLKQKRIPHTGSNLGVLCAVNFPLLLTVIAGSRQQILRPNCCACSSTDACGKAIELTDSLTSHRHRPDEILLCHSALTDSCYDTLAWIILSEGWVVWKRI